ncbi:MAG: hypothetical protein ACO3K4_10660 [Paracoccaceae bacterium]
MVTKNFEIRGNFDEIALHDWIVHRSTVLGLDISIHSLARNAISFCATGHMVLLDAMEIACSLGPSDAMVDDIQSTELNAKKIKTKK